MDAPALNPSPSPETANAAEATKPATTAARAGVSWAGLKRRTVSGIVLAALVIGAEILGGLYFTGLILLAATQMTHEWNRMTAAWGLRWRLIGVVYVVLPCLSLLWLRDYYTPGGEISFRHASESGGLQLVLYLMASVWATDIGAYFAGRSIGGPKIAPLISPNKTWAGLVGGMLAAAAVGVAAQGFTPFPTSIGSAIAIGAVLAIVAQTGDFFESWLKRRAGVKDSGTLIPGHGGLLDRVDGLVFAAPALVLIICIFGQW